MMMDKTEPWESQKFVDSYILMENGLLAKRLLYDQILEHINPAENNDAVAIDLGSGISTIAPEVENRGYRYLGIDQSVVMINHARPITNGLINGNLLSSLPFKSAAADLVLATNVLYNFGVEEIDSILNDVSRITKPGGALLLTNPVKEADNSRIIKQEWQLRGGGVKGFLRLAIDIFANRDFLIEQSRLAKEATKLSLEEWTAVLNRNGFDVVLDSNAYADQALIIKAQKRKD